MSPLELNSPILTPSQTLTPQNRSEAPVQNNPTATPFNINEPLKSPHQDFLKVIDQPVSG